jgi:hypothetical protein
MKNKTQVELLKEIIELKEDNPDADIIFMINNDELSDDKYTWHEIKYVEQGCRVEDGVYDSIEDACEAVGEEEDRDVPPAEVKQYAEAVILVYTGAPIDMTNKA